jgi:non-canonical poly(A) RNA polymerase PAPD5/7
MVEGVSQFKDVNDLFVSDDESDDSAMDLEEPDPDAEPSKKRVKTNGTAPAAQEQPKWSNPDPYFIVPPVDESRHQRKDVVQLLRKAKVEAEKAAPAANAVSRNADFISFGDEEEEGEEELIRPDAAVANGEVSEDGEIDSDEQMGGSRGAGDAPLTNGHTEKSAQLTQQGFSHLRNLHQVPTPQPNPQPNHPHAVTNEMQAREDSVEIVSERVLNEARDVLAEINAEDKRGARKPQTGGRGGRAPHGQKRQHDSDGDITRSWQAKDRASATPWHIDHSQAPDTVYW